MKRMILLMLLLSLAVFPLGGTAEEARQALAAADGRIAQAIGRV